MLTYSAPHAVHNRATPAPKHPWALCLLVLAWLWSGVFSHDLWTPSEPELYTAIEAFVHSPTWLPTLFGEPYWEAAPVYIWLAGSLLKLLSPLSLDPYATARISSVIFASIGLTACGIAGNKLLGQGLGRTVVLILMGSAGLLFPAHFIHAAIVPFAAIGLIFWGISIATKQVFFAAILSAAGWILIGQSMGWLVAGTAWLVILLCGFSPLWRSKRFSVFFGVASAITLPFAILLPLVLFFTQNALFTHYIQHHIWGAFGGTAHFQAGFALHYYATELLWFAFPALPLSLWTLSRGGTHTRAYGILLLLWLGAFSLVLTFLPVRDQDNLMLLLPALALLGAAQLDNLRRGAAAFLNWFGIMTFGFAALFLWVGFIAMNYGFPSKLAERAAYFSPYYTRDIAIFPVLCALLFTPMWLIAITRRHIRGRQAITNWAAGTTFIWVLLMTLFLPWIDAAKSHRPIVQQMQNALPETVRNSLISGSQCLYIDPQSENTRIAWQQYGILPFSSSDTNCRYHLYAFHPKNPLAVSGSLLWQGHRPRNKKEYFGVWDTHAQP
ncbi:MAG: glycosyltransferase family 39 protein [Alysiella sp.]|uniref:ArnT family glycosyltransferase n=1 Tax=Alysiella sp. TaxID=1872483 RepID=UPI0026DC9944|nr:glycosyltransferase family 39 protein [Alysiella sp.]MDO4433649.1 glycosyltransferase family 39 protein [Alysiella sp.]